MTSGPQFYDWDGNEVPVSWHRLLPEDEVGAALPDPPLPKRMRPMKRLARMRDSNSPRGFRLQVVPFDPLEGREVHTHDVGTGYDRHEVESYMHSDSEPLSRPLDLPWEFGDLLRARDAASKILRAYNFPPSRPILPSRYERTTQPLAFAHAWAWSDEGLVWCEGQSGDGMVFLREADKKDIRHVLRDRSGREVVYVPARMSWFNLDPDRFHAYLPQTSAFHWAWQVENLCWFSDTLTSHPSSSSLGEPNSKKAWRELGSTGYVFGSWFTDFHSRRRHEADINYGRRRKPGAVNQGVAGANNAKVAAWDRWGKFVQPWVKSFISNSKDPNLGVSKIHEAVAEAIGSGDLRDVSVPTDPKTFRAALRDWEKQGLIPTWSGLERHRKGQPR